MKITFFYITLAILGFVLLFIDSTPGHQLGDHFEIFKHDPDILAGTILLFFSGFQLGRK